MRAFCVLFLAIASFFAAAQSVPKLIRVADELFEADRYLDAIEFYEKIAGLDKQNYLARYRLGYCYKQTLQYVKAEKTFIELGNIAGNEYRAKALYNYGTLLKLESNFEDADSIFSFLIALPDADTDLIDLSRKQKEGCLLALRQKKIDRGFTLSLLEEVNSKFHDFGAVINPTNKELVFASTRNLPGVQYEGSQYDGVLPDLVAYEKRNERWRFASSDQKFSTLNTQWSEGSGSFTEDGRTFYFSSCRGEGGDGCDIMVSYLIDGRWTEPVKLNEYINEEGSENKQPSISASGDTLFFVSDRPGGFGASDIWMSLKGLEAESWTPAINMGHVINSPENDITPYYSSAFNCLLFASDGHIGYGGYDLYAGKGESFFEPHIYNLGYPFNSPLDDTYFAISDTVGFMSSNREDNRHLNLYSFPVNNESLFLSLLISGESLIDSRIVSKFRDIRSLDLVTFRVEDYQGYELFDPVKRDKPRPEILTDGSDEAISEDAPTLSTVVQNTGDGRYRIPYEKQYFGYGHYMLRPEARQSLDDLVAQLENQAYTSLSILAYTDHLGTDSFNIDLSQNRGKVIRAYLALKGVPLEKINVFARGELKPEGEKDHIFRRIFSRKVEIVIDADEPITLRSAKTYIVTKDDTPSGLAQKLNVDARDLISWNGLRDDLVPIGSTIRIFNPPPSPPSDFVIDEEGSRQLVLEGSGK